MSSRPRTTARRSARSLIGAVVLALGLAACGTAAAEWVVDVYHSPERPVHGEVVDALSQALRDESVPGIRLRRIDLDGSAAAGVDSPPSMRLAIGASASQWLAHRDGVSPRLFGLIPSTVWQSLQTGCDLADGRDSAAFIDRPLTEHLRLAAAFVRDSRPVGVLLGPTSVDQRPALEATAQRLGVALSVEQVTDASDVGPALRRLVDDAGALLALPDPVVFNRNSLYAILLTTYGAGVPTIGYSEPMVRAGAAAAVHTRPSDAGRDLARLIRQSASLGSLPLPRRVPTASITLNVDVIRSLRLDVASESVLLEQLSRGAP